MANRRGLMVLGIMFWAVVVSSRAALAGGPPATPVRDVIDDYFGVKISDPYRWLEDLKSPEVQAWFQAQGKYADGYLMGLPSRAGFRSAIEKYVNSEPANISDVVREPAGDSVQLLYFFIKTLPTDNTGKLYVRQGLHGTDRLLVDTDKFTGAKGEPAAINYYSPSWDGKYVAVGISSGGSEAATIHILDVSSGTELAETIDRAEIGDVNWLPDGKGFCYVRLKEMKKGESELDKYLDSGVYLHRLGTKPDDDVVVMKRGVSDLLKMNEVDEPAVSIQPGSKWVVGEVDHGVENELTLYVSLLDSLGTQRIPWKKVCDVEDEVTGHNVRGDDLYLTSHKDAPHFKLLKVSMDSPELAKAEVVLPEGPEVLRGVWLAGDGIYAREMKGGLARMMRLGYGESTPATIAMPFEGDAWVEACDVREDGVLLGAGSWIRGRQIYSYDPKSASVTNTGLQPAGPFDSRDDLESLEVEAPSWDGTPVPLSIVYKKGTKLDGTNPTSILAYGAYGISYDSGFSLSALAWLDRGGVDAIAHVRGGGENGQEWYKAGYKLTKPNTWRDLIACGEYLVQKKYTNPGRLGIWGGSAGGITIGRAITEKPELFAAADIRAGCVNSVRGENSANGITNIPEFGTATTQEGFEDLYAMDAYLHVRDGVRYPGVILTVGMNDPRVAPWQPAKMAGRLQAASSSGRPVLLRVDFKGGHGIGASKAQWMDQTADMFAFFWDQFGMDEK
jgi:prolyl oligopeptidase